MTKKETAAPLHVDLYIRVSGQEQAIKGLSLEAQQEALEEYARERGWVIVCQRQYEIVRKRRRNFAVFRRGCG